MFYGWESCLVVILVIGGWFLALFLINTNGKPTVDDVKNMKPERPTLGGCLDSLVSWFFLGPIVGGLLFIALSLAPALFLFRLIIFGISAAIVITTLIYVWAKRRLENE